MAMASQPHTKPSRKTLLQGSSRFKSRKTEVEATTANTAEAEPTGKEKSNSRFKSRKSQAQAEVEKESPPPAKPEPDRKSLVKPVENAEAPSSKADSPGLLRFRLLVNKVMLLLARGYEFPEDGRPMDIDPIHLPPPEDVPDDFHFEEPLPEDSQTTDQEEEQVNQTDQPPPTEPEESPEDKEAEEVQPILKSPEKQDEEHRHSSIDGIDLNGITLAPSVIQKLKEYGKLTKVAFMSSAERQYYPEFPGYSKFGQVFAANGLDPSIPPPEFYTSPFAERLTKPISTKGYGIGGLSGPRFAPLLTVNVPAPNAYQKDMQRFTGKQHQFPVGVWKRYGLLGPEDKITDDKVSRKLFNLWGKCHQTNVGFGRSMRQPRFAKQALNDTVGPGHYAVRVMKPPRPPILTSFMRGPTALNPTTKLHCTFGEKEHCIECLAILTGERDYYRSRFRINPVPIRAHVDRTDDHHILMDAVERSKMEREKKKLKRVLLCRHCYCKAVRGESYYFKNRGEIERLFEKTRHCGYIHEHNGIPEYTIKASCYWTRHLTRKEGVLSKYYSSDVCEKRIVARSNKEPNRVGHNAAQ